MFTPKISNAAVRIKHASHAVYPYHSLTMPIPAQITLEERTLSSTDCAGPTAPKTQPKHECHACIRVGLRRMFFTEEMLLDEQLPNEKLPNKQFPDNSRF